MVTPKSKAPISGFVRSSYGEETITDSRKIIKSKHGDMYEGPEYDRYAKAQGQLDLLQDFVARASEFLLSRDEALTMVETASEVVSGSHDVSTGLQLIRARLMGDSSADAPRGLWLVQCGLHQVANGVSSIASSVPRPPDPLTVYPEKTEPWGTAWRRANG